MILQRLRQNPIARRLRRLVGGPRTLRNGVGAGLRFDPAGADLDYARGLSELPVQHAMARHLRPGMVCYDIGANVGFFSLIAARLVGPSGHVYAFEPVPANVAALERNRRLNQMGNLSVLACAVTDRSGSARLILARHIGGATLEAAGAPPDATAAIEVEALAIDTALEQDRLRPPDLVKIDVEGAELQVLHGMRHSIAAHRPIVIYEVDAASQPALAAKQAAVDTWLAEQGYLVTALADSYPHSGWHVAHGLALPATATQEEPTA